MYQHTRTMPHRRPQARAVAKAVRPFRADAVIFVVAASTGFAIISLILRALS